MDTREYKLVDLGRHDLEALQRRLASCMGLMWIPAEIRPFRINPSFDDQFGPKESMFWRLFERHQGAIRKYGLRVVHPKNAEYMAARFWMTVRIAENAHQLQPSYNYPTITLYDRTHDPRRFDTFRHFMEQEWHLVPTEKQLKADLLNEFSKSVFDADLRAATEANMRDHDYDAAMRNAATLIESTLREACLNVGAANAHGQTLDALAVTAYHENTGCLTPPWPIALQAHKGVQLLFQGFTAYIRNAYTHNAVVMGTSREYIVQFLKGCEFLLTVVKASTKR